MGAVWARCCENSNGGAEELRFDRRDQTGTVRPGQGDVTPPVASPRTPRAVADVQHYAGSCCAPVDQNEQRSSMTIRPMGGAPADGSLSPPRGVPDLKLNLPSHYYPGGSTTGSGRSSSSSAPRTWTPSGWFPWSASTSLNPESDVAVASVNYSYAVTK